MPVTHTQVGCPYCGASCDDLEILVSDDGKEILEVRNACVIGNEIFHHATKPGRVKLPRLRQEDGIYKEIPYDEAVDYTAKTCSPRRSP